LLDSFLSFFGHNTQPIDEKTWSQRKSWQSPWKFWRYIYIHVFSYTKT
jgi:hypothetical protein